MPDSYDKLCSLKTPAIYHRDRVFFTDLACDAPQSMRPEARPCLVRRILSTIAGLFV